MKNSTLLLILFMLISAVSFGQDEKKKTKATFTSKATNFKIVPSIAKQIENGTFIPAVFEEKEVNPRRTDGNKIVPGKGLPIGGDPLRAKDGPGSMLKNPGKAPIITWDAASSGVTPTDPTGAVGPDHYVNAWNSQFRIWDKEGNALTTAASLATIWTGESSGDPIVLYDQFADRFIITQFSFSNSLLVAISQGPDPVNDDWYTFEFGLDAFPDYPKYSIWSDGYYVTANKNSGSASTSEVVYALERDLIIDGNADAQIVGFSLSDIATSGFYSPLSFNCSGTELPPAGGLPIVYMQDDAWAGISEDHLKIWTIDVDWTNTANSTISEPQEIITEVFDGVFDGGSFSNLPQSSGSDIDALQAAVMQLAQYRRFATHNSVVFNFVVDLDGNDDFAGIRWYELRQDNDGDDWEIYQEGTYEQPDGHSAFCGSMAMDTYGNIGLAYTIVSTTQNVSIRYTGRFSSDPLNSMTIAEEILEDGSQINPSFRYGDYSQLTVDPVDDKTFWMIAEYFASSTRKNVVGAFKFAPDFNIDAGVVGLEEPTDGTLSATQSVTVAVRNFGIDTISDVPVSYSVDGGTVTNEIYMGDIPPSSTVFHTFAATSDMSTVGNTYAITAYTSLVGDEDLNNDTLTSSVTHLQPNDIGVVSISDPNSASGLGSAETVKVLIENFGGATQSDFSVYYSINGETPFMDVVAGPLEGASQIEHTFSQDADLSMLGEYEFIAYTALPGDSDNSNDTAMKFVENFMCLPTANCNVGDGFELFAITTIDNPSGCSPDGYGDYTDLIADLAQGSTNELSLTTGYGNQYVKVWIDLNDNFVFEDDELFVDDFILGEGGGSGTFSGTTDVVIPSDAALGEHLMRAKSNWNNGVPDDPCEGTTYGETEDYTANITFLDGLDELSNEPNELSISYLPSNQFEVRFDAVNTNESLMISVHNTMGQQVISNRVQGVNGSYFYDFDMSYAAPGVYLVRLGNSTFGKVKKIVVK